MRKLYWIRKQNADDKRGERLPLRHIFHPKWKVDERAVVNYYQASMNNVWLVLEWLLIVLLNKGVLSVADFASFPLQDKLKGELIEALTDKEKKDLEQAEVKK